MFLIISYKTIFLFRALYFKISASQETAWKQSTSVAVPSVCVQKREFKEAKLSSNDDNESNKKSKKSRWDL